MLSFNKKKCSLQSDISSNTNNVNDYCNNGQKCLLNCDDIEIAELNRIMEKEMSFCIDTSTVRKYIHDQEQYAAQSLRNQNQLNVNNENEMNSNNFIQMLFRSNHKNNIEDIFDGDNSKDFLSKKEEKNNCGLFIKKTLTNNNMNTRRNTYRHSKTFNSNGKKYLLCNNIYQKDALHMAVKCIFCIYNQIYHNLRKLYRINPDVSQIRTIIYL